MVQPGDWQGTDDGKAPTCAVEGSADAPVPVQGIRGRKLLEGYRGRPAADEEAIHDVLLRISSLVDEVPEIDDLDINPMLAMAPGEGCRILDARIHVRGSADAAQA